MAILISKPDIGFDTSYHYFACAVQAYPYWLEPLDRRHIPRAQDIGFSDCHVGWGAVFCGGVATPRVPCSFTVP